MVCSSSTKISSFRNFFRPFISWNENQHLVTGLSFGLYACLTQCIGNPVCIAKPRLSLTKISQNDVYIFQYAGKKPSDINTWNKMVKDLESADKLLNLRFERLLYSAVSLFTSSKDRIFDREKSCLTSVFLMLS